MFILVQLVKGWSEPLWYRVPNNLIDRVVQGTVLFVPLRTKVVPAVVIRAVLQLPTSVAFAVRDLSALSVFPSDEKYHQFLQKIATLYGVAVTTLYQRIASFLATQSTTEIFSKVDNNAFNQASDMPCQLTDEQEAVVDYLRPHITTPSFKPTVLYGVTGSGKTEIYKKLIQQAIAEGKTVLFLVPEVGLAVQFEHVLRKQLPAVIPVCGFHSATRPTEKRAVWAHLCAQAAHVIVGIHLPVLLPITNLGLIIVDEEHERGFIEKKHPRINSREMAIWRAQHYHVPIVLGSATPSIASLYQVQTHGWKLFRLTYRFAGTFPSVIRVSLKAKTRRKNFWITQTLYDEIAATLDRNEQVILYLNRRGYSFFVQCSQCGFVVTCVNCSVSLTVHMRDQQAWLLCHYCGHRGDMPTCCISCAADAKKFIKKGIGTQYLVGVLQELFPSARIARADLDTTRARRAWHETVAAFERGEIDILIGTQSITKGYHFPCVTLVGVIWADLNLNFPSYDAAECALQQLIQVIGRAGRSGLPGRAVVQYIHEHPIFKYLDETLYATFYADELVARQQAHYPPCARLVRLELWHADETTVDREAEELAMLLSQQQAVLDGAVIVLGPAPPLVSRREGVYVRDIYLKGGTLAAALNMVRRVQEKPMASSLGIVPTA